MARWVEDDTVRRALATLDASQMNRSGATYCLSSAYRYCVVLRHHDSWLIDGQGWRDSNAPPSVPEQGRMMLNFFWTKSGGSDRVTGGWFKVFVPLRLEIGELFSEGESFCLTVDGIPRRCSFDALPRLMWDVMSGDAQSEEDIELAFESIWRSKGEAAP